MAYEQAGLDHRIIGDWLRITGRFALLIGVFSVVVHLDESVLDGAVTRAATESSAEAVGVVLRTFGADASSSENRVTHAGSTFIVTPECIGYEVLGLFAAAVLAVPLPWALRLRGLLTGLSILGLLNFVRMLFLVVFAARWPELHSVGHLYTWPAIVVVVALGLWLTWVNGAYDRVAAVRAELAAGSP